MRSMAWGLTLGRGGRTRRHIARGYATCAAVGAAVAVGVGSASGQALCEAASVPPSELEAFGTCIAAATGAAVAVGVGEATGSAECNAASTSASGGSCSGVATAAAVGAAVAQATGSASGTGTAAAVGACVAMTSGSAAGTCVAAAASQLEDIEGAMAVVAPAGVFSAAGTLAIAGSVGMSAPAAAFSAEGTMEAAATFPVVEASNNNASTANQTNFTASLPTGISAGDLLVVCVFKDDDDPITSYPTGWNLLAAPVQGTANRASVLFRWADGNEGASISLPGDSENYAAKSWRISGASSTVAPEIVITTAATGNNDPGALTPSWGSADTLWLVYLGVDGDSSITGFPTNYTGTGSQTSTSSTTTDRVCDGWAEYANAASSEDPGTFTNTSASNISFLIAVPPSSVTASPITLSSAGSKNVTSAASNDTTSVTRPALTNGRMFVCVQYEHATGDGATITSAVYGGVTMATVTDGTDSASGDYDFNGSVVCAYRWFTLKHAELPAEGANNLVITLGANALFSYSWYFLSGCSQATNVVDVGIDTAASGSTSKSATLVASAANQAVFAGTYKAANALTFTTIRYGTNGGGYGCRYAAMEQATGGTNASVSSGCRVSGNATGSQTLTSSWAVSAGLSLMSAFIIAAA
jgi:hypothetical protein